MAEVDESQFSLMSLEDDLTCSICLSPFDCPVTLPCGHNFCQDCLLTTWDDSSYSCPQCRTIFTTKPELKKNTVLSTVVETFTLRSSESEVEERDVICCDTCMEAEASQTCLTCMASFCEEHLQPHRENPNFRLHQLTEPVGDLSEHICSDHHKLMEFFCSQHGRPICSTCLQQVHRGCSFMSLEEQRNLKESDLTVKLDLLDGKIVKNEDVVFQMRNTHSKLAESATNRKKALAAEYQQLRDMLAREERDALNAVDCELENGQTKLKGLMKKFTENINNMNKAKEDIHSLLSQSQTLAFLQASFDLPGAANFDPYAPRISLDSKKVLATQTFVTALKQHLTEIFKQPIESRQLELKPGEHAETIFASDEKTPVSGGTGSQLESEEKTPVSGGAGSQPQAEVPQPQQQTRMPTPQSPDCPPIQPVFQPVPVTYYISHGGWNPSQFAQGPQRAPGPHRFSKPTSLGSQSKPGPKMKPQKNPPKPAQSTGGSQGHSVEKSLEKGKPRPKPAAATKDKKEKPPKPAPSTGSKPAPSTGSKQGRSVAKSLEKGKPRPKPAAATKIKKGK